MQGSRLTDGALGDATRHAERRRLSEMRLSRISLVVCFYFVFSCVHEEGEARTPKNAVLSSGDTPSKLARKRSPQAEHEVSPNPTELVETAESSTSPGETTVSVQVESKNSQPTAAPNVEKPSDEKDAAKSSTRPSTRSKPKAKPQRKVQRKNGTSKTQTRLSKPVASLEKSKQVDNHEVNLNKSSYPETRLDSAKIQDFLSDKNTMLTRKHESDTRPSDNSKDKEDSLQTKSKNDELPDDKHSKEHTEGLVTESTPSKAYETKTITDAFNTPDTTESSISTDSTTDVTTTEKEDVDNIESIVDEHSHKNNETQSIPDVVSLSMENTMNKNAFNDKNEELIRKIIAQVKYNEQANRRKYTKEDDHDNIDEFSENRRSFSIKGGLSHRPNEDYYEEEVPSNSNVPFDANRFYLSDYNQLDYKSVPSYQQPEAPYRVPLTSLFRHAHNGPNLNTEIPRLAFPSDFERALNQRIDYQTHDQTNLVPKRRTFSSTPQFNAAQSLPQDVPDQNSRFTEQTPKTVFPGLSQDAFADTESEYSHLNNVFRQPAVPLTLNQRYSYGLHNPVVYKSQPKQANAYLPTLNVDTNLSHAQKYQQFFNNLYFRDPQLQNQYSINEYVNYLQTIQSLDPYQNILSPASHCHTINGGSKVGGYQFNRTLGLSENMETFPKTHVSQNIHLLNQLNSNTSPEDKFSYPILPAYLYRPYGFSSISPYQYFPAPNQYIQQIPYLLSNPNGYHRYSNPPIGYANGYNYSYNVAFNHHNCQNYMQYLKNFNCYSRNNPYNDGCLNTGMYGFG